MIGSALVSGLGLGSMYGLLSLGFYITYSVSSTVNFAQGSSMMLGAVFAYTFAVKLGWHFIPAAAISLVLCAVYGLVVELVAVRPFARRGSNAWLMATVALGIIADNTVLFTFGKEPRGFVLPWASEGLAVLGIHVSKMQLAIPAFGLGLAAVLHWFARRTKYGKAMLAVVQNADAARLMGIDVRKAIAGSYAASGVFAGIAGLLIAPLFNVSSEMGTMFGLKAFAAAIIGGLGSAWGVMLAGLCLGLLEAFATTMLGSVYTQILTFAAIIVILFVLPNGILGRAGVKKV